MRVVLSGYYGFHNVGDEAILLSIITALRSYKDDINITVLSNDPEYTKETYQVDAVNRWKLKEVANTLKGSDGLISGGGSLLQDKTGFRSIPYYTGIMMIAHFFKKPFFIYAQGMGPVSRSYNQKLMKKVLSKATYLSVRDEESYELLEHIGVKKKIELVPDPVIGFSLEVTKNNWLERKQFTKPFLSVSIRDWPSDEPFKEKVAQALDRFSKEGYEIVFLPMHGKHDDDTSREVAKMMASETHIFPFDAAIEEKVSLISYSKLLVGMRLHALIFAGISHTPMVGMSYDPKIDSFLKQVDQPQIGHVDEGWTADELYQMIQAQLINSEAEKEKVSKHIQPMKEKATETAKTVIDLLV